MDADGPHRFRNVPFGRDVVQAPGGASDLSHSEIRCAAFAGAGASSASTTCRFRESIPHPVQPLSTLRTPRYRDARKTRSRPACSALDGPDFHWQAHSSFPIAPRIRLSDKTSRFRVQRHLQFLDTFRSLIGCPISTSFTTYCVCLELRSLPSTGITRLQRYYEPLRHPKAPGLSLAGFQLVVAPTTPWGFPCCVRFPCVHAVATTPAQRLGVLFALLHPAVSAFPERVVGSACASSFSRLARRSLALRPAHSRCHQFVTR